MRELPATTAHLPNPLVGLAPDGLEVLDRSALQFPARVLSDQSAGAALVEGIQNFAKYIELQLIGGGVADAYWLGPGIAGEPGNLPFLRRRSPASPYMIWSCAGLPATARRSQARQSAAS